MNRTGYRAVIGLAITHLSLVALSASGFEFPELGKFGDALDFYESMSGANERYGFFAPGIDGQYGVFFDLYYAGGKKKVIQLESHINHETDLRIGNIFNQFFSESGEDAEDLQRSVAASLAGTVLGRNPDATAVNVRLENFSPVSMKEYRSGSRPSWSSIYEAKFVYTARK